MSEDIEEYLKKSITKHTNASEKIWNDRILSLMNQLEMCLKESTYDDAVKVCDSLIKAILDIRGISNGINWLRSELSDRYKNKFNKFGGLESE